MIIREVSKIQRSASECYVISTFLILFDSYLYILTESVRFLVHKSQRCGIDKRVNKWRMKITNWLSVRSVIFFPSRSINHIRVGSVVFPHGWQEIAAPCRAFLLFYRLNPRDPLHYNLSRRSDLQILGCPLQGRLNSSSHASCVTSSLLQTWRRRAQRKSAEQSLK
jgi:hypothetical protein